MSQRARIYTILTVMLLAALIAGSVWAYPRLPERIPMHFDLAGRVDRWASRSAGTWFLLPMVAVALALMLGAISLYAAGHPASWNMPDKRRFLAMDAAAQAPIVARMREMVAFVGMVVTALMGVIQAGIYRAAVEGAGREPRFMTIGIVVALALILGEALRTSRWVRRQVGAAP